MGCCGKEESSGVSPINSKNCVCDVVRAILDIQTQGATDDCDCPTNCFLEPLGGLVNPTRTNADTRVFMLLTKDGTPFKAFFRDLIGHTGTDCRCFSVYFRVEDVFDGCCATLRVLEPLGKNKEEIDILNEKGTDVDLHKLCKVRNFNRTNSCITVDLNCFCAVQCIADVDLNVC